MGKLLWRIRGERSLFRTHQPAFQDPDRAVGEVVDCDGELYRVTRWLELPKVALSRGGYAPEWDVWGRRATSAEVEEELEREARRILDGEEGPRGTETGEGRSGSRT